MLHRAHSVVYIEYWSCDWQSSGHVTSRACPASLPQFIDDAVCSVHVTEFSQDLQLLHLEVGRVIVPGQTGGRM